MTDLRQIIETMLAERAAAFGWRYPADTADRLMAAGEMARQKTAHLPAQRTAGIAAIEAELARIEHLLSTPGAHRYGRSATGAFP